MSGRPVWLASVTLRNKKGQMIPTGCQTPKQRQRAKQAALNVLEGVGDDSRERGFRKSLAVYVQRGLTAEEEAGLPDAFRCTRPTDPAGGPVELLWSRGVADILSTRPCLKPLGKPLWSIDPSGFSHPEALFLEDCGGCPPCLARITVQERARAAAGVSR